MAKAIMAASKEKVEEIKETAKQPIPELSFTEDEVQKVANFINFVYKTGTFSMKMSDMKSINGMLNDMHAHVSKIEKYIFEFKKVSAAKKAVEA